MNIWCSSCLKCVNNVFFAAYFLRYAQTRFQILQKIKETKATKWLLTNSTASSNNCASALLSSWLARTKFLCLYRFCLIFFRFIFYFHSFSLFFVFGLSHCFWLLGSRCQVAKALKADSDLKPATDMSELCTLAIGLETCNYNNKNKLRELFRCVLSTRESGREKGSAAWWSEVSVRPIGTLAIRFYGQQTHKHRPSFGFILLFLFLCLPFRCVLILGRKHKNVFLCCRSAKTTLWVSVTFPVLRLMHCYIFFVFFYSLCFLPALKFLWYFSAYSPGRTWTGALDWASQPASDSWAQFRTCSCCCFCCCCCSWLLTGIYWRQ